MKNHSRILLKILDELSSEHGLAMKTYAKDWIVALEKSEKTTFVMGYDWDINGAATQQIAKDKCATYEILSANGIAAVEHFLMLTPEDLHFVNNNRGNWSDLLNFAAQYDYQLVVKPNTGTGGVDVLRITNSVDLEIFTHQLLKSYKSLAFCQLLDIQNEYRVVLLDNELQLIFNKTRPYIVGDGVHPLGELLTQQNYPISMVQSKDFAKKLTMDYCPKMGEKIELNWKHNLAYGATPIDAIDSQLVQPLLQLAKKAASAIQLRFGSVDIVEVNGQYKVLEINSGVMLESYSNYSLKNYEKAKTIYERVLMKIFN